MIDKELSFFGGLETVGARRVRRRALVLIISYTKNVLVKCIGRKPSHPTEYIISKKNDTGEGGAHASDEGRM